MWCSNCRQDVPAIAQGEMARCARCGRFLMRSTGASESQEATAGDAVHSAASSNTVETMAHDFPMPQNDDWLLEEQMRLLRARLGFPQSFAVAPLAAAMAQSQQAASPASRTKMASRRPAVFAWLVLMLGLMAFACGGVLVGWSYFGHRPDLWSMGVPMAVGGQF